MSSRRTRASTRKKPSASFYVGYCEDQETPEMIMRKFALLEEIQKEQQKKKWEEEGAEDDSDDEKAPAAGLTEESMQKLFVETSMFTMDDTKERNKYAADFLVNNHGDIMTEEEAYYFSSLARQDGDYHAAYGDLNDSEEERDWARNVDGPDDEYWDFSDDEGKGRRRRRRRGGKRSSGKRRPAAKSDAMGINLREYGDDTICDLKQHYDPYRTRVFKCMPHPMVSTFAHYIKPYDPAQEDPTWVTKQRDGEDHGGALYGEADLYKDDLLPLIGGKPVYAVYLNLPWRFSERDPEFEKTFTLEDFKRIDITRKVLDAGVVFVYVPKMLWIEVWKHMEAQGYYWVEEAMVVPRDPNYRIKRQDSEFFGVSRESLHLFRRKSKTSMPMQHQRVTNVHFLSGESKAEYTYDLIEQMFPPKVTGGARLVELYQCGHRREGWAHVVHKSSS